MDLTAGSAAAQRQRQGDEAAVARGVVVTGAAHRSATASARCLSAWRLRSFFSAASASLSIAAALMTRLTSSSVNWALPTRSGARPGQLHAQHAVAIGALGLAQHRGQRFLLGLRALHDGHAAAAAGVAVELERGFRIERLVDGLERGRFLVLGADRYDRAFAIDVIEVLIADDGRRAVFVHDLLDHVGLRRLLVLRKGQVAGDEISAVGARGRREAADSTSPFCLGPAGRLKFSARDVADRGAAEFLLLDVGLGVGAPLERRFEDRRARMSAVESAEMPRMSGRSLPENAVSGVFGLMS